MIIRTLTIGPKVSIIHGFTVCLIMSLWQLACEGQTFTHNSFSSNQLTILRFRQWTPWRVMTVFGVLMFLQSILKISKSIRVLSTILPAIRLTSGRIGPVFSHNVGYQHTTTDLLFKLRFIHCTMVSPFILPFLSFSLSG